jgi:hypothetical protein
MLQSESEKMAGELARLVALETARLAAAGDAKIIHGLRSWLTRHAQELNERIEREEAAGQAYLERHARRARRFWDHDRRQEAEALGQHLASNPPAIAEELQLTPQGCDWMITRWELLARSAERESGWTPTQAAQAFDLLGTPRAERSGLPGAAVEQGSFTNKLRHGPTALAREQIRLLRKQKAEVADTDAFERVLIEARLPVIPPPELLALRESIAELQQRIRRCLRQLKTHIAHMEAREKAEQAARPALKLASLPREPPETEERPPGKRSRTGGRSGLDS